MDRSPSEGRLVVIDRGRERFVRLQLAALRDDFAGQQPVDGREGPSAFVVRRDDEVDVPRLVVRVAERDDGDADVQRLPQRLLVRRGIRDEDHLRLDEVREVRFGEGAVHERAGEHLRADVLGEQPRGLLPILAGRDDEDVLRLESPDELRGFADPRIRLLDVEDIQAVDPNLVDERLHVGAFLLRPDVDAGGQVQVLRDQESLDARLFFFLHHAPAWSCSSIRISSFNFAIRSPPTAPVLMPRHPNATARWAIVSSVVSPDRCDITVACPAEWARSTAARVSESVPIWFGLIRIALAARCLTPGRSRSTFVRKMSSPITLHRSPMRFVSSVKDPKSSWSNGSSTLKSEKSRASRSTKSICSFAERVRSRYRYFPPR